MLLQYDPHFFSTLSKNLGNWRDFFGQMVYRPPWQNISRTPMPLKSGARDLLLMIKLVEGVQRRATRALLSSFSWLASKLSIRASRETQSSTRTELTNGACWQAVVKQYNERPERIDLLHLASLQQRSQKHCYILQPLKCGYYIVQFLSYSKLRFFSSKVK